MEKKRQERDHDRTSTKSFTYWDHSHVSVLQQSGFTLQIKTQMGSILHFNALPLERNSATLTSFGCPGLLPKQQPVLMIFTHSLMTKWRGNVKKAQLEESHVYKFQKNQVQNNWKSKRKPALYFAFYSLFIYPL